MFHQDSEYLCCDDTGREVAVADHAAKSRLQIRCTSATAVLGGVSSLTRHPVALTVEQQLQALYC